MFVFFCKSHVPFLHFTFRIHDRKYLQSNESIGIHGTRKRIYWSDSKTNRMAFKALLVLVRNSLDEKKKNRNIKLIHWMWSSWPGKLNIRFLFHFLSGLVHLYTAHIGHRSNVVVVSQFSVLIKRKEKMKRKKSKNIKHGAWSTIGDGLHAKQNEQESTLNLSEFDCNTKKDNRIQYAQPRNREQVNQTIALNVER